MKKLENYFLYLVVLGGRAEKANIELHDVRWVVGSKIEDTYDTLRKDWFGSPEGLHIDSYKKINFVDGYKVNPRNIQNKKINNNKFHKELNNSKYLWFVNIGGYDPSSMQEKHEFGLIVASNQLEAKNTALSKWLIGCKKKHKDDISKLKSFTSLDNCQVINRIGKWQIELKPVENLVKQNNLPDWLGYKRIDKN